MTTEKMISKVLVSPIIFEGKKIMPSNKPVELPESVVAQLSALPYSPFAPDVELEAVVEAESEPTPEPEPEPTPATPKGSKAAAKKGS